MAAAVRVRLFAHYAELLGRDEATISLRLPATVGDVVREVRALPGGVGLPDKPLAALNTMHTTLDAAIHDGDEVALLPPLAGG